MSIYNYNIVKVVGSINFIKEVFKLDTKIEELTSLLENSYHEVSKGFNGDLHGTMLFLTPPMKNCSVLIFGRNPEGLEDNRCDFFENKDLKENEMAFIESQRNCIIENNSRFDMGIIKLFCLAYHGLDKKGCWYKNKTVKDEECPGIEVLKHNSVVAELIPFRTNENKNWKKLISYLNSKTEDGESVSEKYCVPIINKLIAYTNPKVIITLGDETIYYFNKWLKNIDIKVYSFSHPSERRLTDETIIQEAQELRKVLPFEEIKQF